jgi:hypothetical protein
MKIHLGFRLVNHLIRHQSYRHHQLLRCKIQEKENIQNMKHIHLHRHRLLHHRHHLRRLEYRLILVIQKQ